MTRAAAAFVLLAIGCGAAAPVGKPVAKAVAPKTMRVVREAGRPAIAIVTREGDPEPFVAAFVATNGIAERGAVVPVALAALFESRLPRARVTPQGDGVRIVAPAAELERVSRALVEPVGAATDLALVKQKLAALAALPRPSAEELPVATCEGALVPPADLDAPASGELETWRARAVVSERVGLGAVGASPKAPALPSGARAVATAQAASFAVLDSAGEAPAGSASVSIAWRAGLSAVSAAGALGDPRSSLVAMLAAAGVARLRSVSGTLSPSGACLALRLRVEADAATSGGAERIAQTIALAETKARDALAGSADDLATPADAAAAAEQAAIVALASADAVASAEPYVVVGAPGATSETRDALTRARAAATRAWASPIVEARSRVERGQPAAWMLLASPCGTSGEADTDAGASAAFALAAAAAARAHGGVSSEPWIAGDGVGVIASAPNANVLADVLSRAVLVEPLEGVRAAQSLLHDAARPGLAGLALALAPGRPASIVPTGTPLSLLRVSEPAILARAESLRRGPLRVALLDNADGADAAMTRVDRWVLRDGPRACPAQAAIAPPKPGTYAVATDDGTSEAYLALAVPPSFEAEAAAIAGVLDESLLAKALGDGLARESSARVLGPPGGRALVVHVDAPASALDAAVAQTRALLDRVRQGAIADADLARHASRVREVTAVKMRDPRERLIALFRAEPAKPEPSLETVRTAAAAFVHDEGLVIVAARPRTKRSS